MYIDLSCRIPLAQRDEIVTASTRVVEAVTMGSDKKIGHRKYDSRKYKLAK